MLSLGLRPNIAILSTTLYTFTTNKFMAGSRAAEVRYSKETEWLPFLKPQGMERQRGLFVV